MFVCRLLRLGIELSSHIECYQVGLAVEICESPLNDERTISNFLDTGGIQGKRSSAYACGLKLQGADSNKQCIFLLRWELWMAKVVSQIGM